MVESMASRLQQLRGDLSYEKFGDIAGVSSTAVMKWLAGGNAKDPPLRKIAARYGTTVEWIRYGTNALPGIAQPHGDLTQLAVDIAQRWMSLSSERQEWFRDLIFTIHFVEKRFPAMRKGRPKGESYTNLEAAFERDMMQLKIKFE